MQKIDVAGLKVNTLTKAELIGNLKNRIQNNQQTWVTTVYSEFLYAGLKDPKVMTMLNKADIALPDGIGIFWAHKFLNLPLTAKTYFGKILQSLWQVKYSLAGIIFNKKWIYNLSAPSDALGGISPQEERKLQAAVIPPLLRGGAGERLQEKIPGSEIIWDIAKMAAENNLSIYLLGGYGNTPELVAKKLVSYKNDGRHFEKSLKIAGYSSKNPVDETITKDINKSGADILFVAFGPIKQEQWIYKHRNDLKSVKLFIGLGGTFDYIAGKRLNPPSFIRKIGLEWLFRLITQPHRFKRIWNATFGLITMLIRYKIFSQYPLRKNAVGVIINKDGKIFLGRKTGSRVDIISTNNPEKWENYWQLPQGGIEKSEDVVAAIRREVGEETGINNLEFIKFSNQTHTYFFNNALRKLIGKNRNYKFKGQTQTIAYFKFTGQESEIIFPKNEEFVEYKWVKPNDLHLIIHEERISLTKIVQADLKEMANKAII